MRGLFRPLEEHAGHTTLTVGVLHFYPLFGLHIKIFCLRGLVVRVPGYRSRDPGFDFQRYQIF
jgi:hypothetical protein